MKRLILLFIISFLTVTAFAQDNPPKPFILKLVEKPVKLKIGQKHKFVFEVVNISRMPLTLSTACASSAILSWKNREGLGIGCATIRGFVDDAYDPVTKKITGKSGTVPYLKSDFFTLQPDATKRFEAELSVPEDMKPRWVTVHIRFWAQFDGKLIGINAWTGTSSLDLKMFVSK